MLTFNPDLLTPTTLTYSLFNLSYALSHCFDMLTLTFLTIWLRCEHAGSSRSGFVGRGGTSFAGSGGSGFAGRGEASFAGHSGSGFAGRGETCFAGSSGHGFAGRKLVVVELSFSPPWQSSFAGSKLVAGNSHSRPSDNLASLGASW